MDLNSIYSRTAPGETKEVAVFVTDRNKERVGVLSVAKMVAEAFGEQLAFLAELDQLKSVVRQSPLINRTRKKNSAEHSCTSRCSPSFSPSAWKKLTRLRSSRCC